MANLLDTIHGCSLNDLLLLSDLWLPVNLRPSAHFLDGLCRQDLIDVLKACLLVFSLSSGSIVPREFQLAGSLETVNGRDSVVISGTGSGKTLLIVIPLLLRPKSVAVTVSPLKRLQTSQVSEFEKWGITTKAINSDTPNDKSLWEDIVHGRYQHLIVSAEQLSLCNGHAPRFSLILQDRRFRKHLAHLNVDEVHNIWTSGVKKHGRDPFRPAWGKLGQARIKLPKSVSVQAMSATLPDPVLAVVRKNLLMTSKATVLRLSANRRNITYATRTMLGGGISDFRNLNCVVPMVYHPPMTHMPKIIIFHDSKEEAANAARFLNRRLPPNLQGIGLVRHYHSSMSDLYLEKAFDDFASLNGICRVLCATSGVSTGLNVLDVDIVIQYGLCTDLLEGIQRAGRAGRDGITASLFLLLVEPWVTTLDLDNCSSDDSTADSMKDFDAPPKSVKHLSGKKSQTGGNAIGFAQSEMCLRDYIATFLDDDTSDALVFSNRWCCDRHGDDFDLQTFFHARIFHNDDIDNPPLPPAPKRKRARLRKARDRKSLLKQLKRWRSQICKDRGGAAFRPATWIIDDKGLSDLVKIHPSLLEGPNSIVTALNETVEWSCLWAEKIFNIIHTFDHPDSDSSDDESPIQDVRRKLRPIWNHVNAMHVKWPVLVG